MDDREFDLVLKATQLWRLSERIAEDYEGTHLFLTELGIPWFDEEGIISLKERVRRLAESKGLEV